MFKQLVILALVAASAYAGIVGNYENCGSTATVNQLRVTDCDAMPCTFTKGREYNVEVDATARSDSNTLPYKVTATVIVPITIIEGDACEELTAGSCPARNGQSFTYATAFDVPATFPQVNTRVTATVKDDNEVTVVCVALDVLIRNSAEADLLALVNWIHETKGEKARLG